MKENTDIPKFGDIFLVRFHPAIGAELKRYRPALIVSDAIQQIDARFTLIAPLTTQPSKATNNFEYLIKDNDVLVQDSIVLAWYLRTIDVTRLERKIGSLNPSEHSKVRNVLQKVFTETPTARSPL